MLVIRHAQMDVFRGTASPEFEAFMFDFIRNFFADEIGDEVDNINAITRYGVKRAAEHNIYKGPNVSRYITCMMYLGSDFDENPFLLWVRKILNTNKNEEEKTELLAKQTLKYLDECSDAENEYLLTALKRFRKPNEEIFPPNKLKNIDDYILERLNWLYPEKCRVIGEKTLADAIRLTIEQAKQKNITEDTALTMFVGLTFMLGINFERDPIYPWLFSEDRERDTHILDVEAIYRLYRRTIKHIDQINS